MPFTFAHPAAILPFFYRKSRFFSLTGLAAGSVVPDFIYFFTLRKDTGGYTHSLKGLLLFDLPVGIFLCFLFHLAVKRSLVGHLPAFLRSRLQPHLSLNWIPFFRRSFFSVCLSVLIGAALHILWDWLTHFSVNYYPENNYIDPADYVTRRKLQLYYLVWAIFSAAGAGLLLLSVFKLPPQPAALLHPVRRWYWLLILGPSTILSVWYISVHPYKSIDEYVVGITAFFLLFLSLVSASVTVQNR